jgi:outer membrane lipoprotein-sorting protein
MKNKTFILGLICGVGLVLTCIAIYFTVVDHRQEQSETAPTDIPADEAYCPEPNQVMAQAEPNEVTSPNEPNEAASTTATAKDMFKDEPEAHALYDKMIETMRNAESLCYRSSSSESGTGPEYLIWMKKPNYFRVETKNIRGDKCGTLVGDGDNLWIFWPQWNSPVSNQAGGNRTGQPKVYMKKAAPLGRHSIGHEVGQLRAGIGMTIIDPSTFHGYTDSLQPYVDGVKSWYTESIDGQECDVIEVSFMKCQRIWYIWLSKQDHLPRKLKQVVRVANPLIGYEYWSDVHINIEVPDKLFVWEPPDGWQEWTQPDLDEKLLKAGTEAPDFELFLADETMVKLSDYRGKIVWLYIWRAG